MPNVKVKPILQTTVSVVRVRRGWMILSLFPATVVVKQTQDTDGWTSSPYNPDTRLRHRVSLSTFIFPCFLFTVVVSYEAAAALFVDFPEASIRVTSAREMLDINTQVIDSQPRQP